MSTFFRAGDTIETARTKRTCRVMDYIGAGGQGEVYRIEFNGIPHALKWYFPETSTADQRACLVKLVEAGPPSSEFLWPLDLATAKSKTTFGYIMPLRESRFKRFLGLVTGKLDPTFYVLTTVGLNLVERFYKLHAQGLCYRDISFGNGFFDPSTGDVLICDNDNVTENRSSEALVLGTPDFMAPEIVRRAARPSTQTDLFSLSVLLFYLFHIQHPLIGKKILQIRSWDLPAREKLFGHEPVFIFHPTDKSNEAIDDPRADPLGEAGKYAIRYWDSIYPTVMKDSFVHAFTDGIVDAEHGRVRESEWRKALLQARDSIYTCSGCNKEIFYDGSRQVQNRCWNCQKFPRLPFRLEVGGHEIVLNLGVKVRDHHLDGSNSYVESGTVADVVAHPSKPNVWGLRNCTEKHWTAQPEGQGLTDLPAGKSIPLADGTVVNFGALSGTIKR